MPNFMEITYEDASGIKALDGSLIELAIKYYGSTSSRGAIGNSRCLEFIFPHYEQASCFAADLRAYFPQVSINKLD